MLSLNPLCVQFHKMKSPRRVKVLSQFEHLNAAITHTLATPSLQSIETQMEQSC